MTLEETRRAGSESPIPKGVTAVVLTHMRPRLAGDVTRSLLETEGLPPDRVIVVVNGIGGLDDPALERRVRMVRLSRNTGPAGGFRAGLTAAFEDPATKWAYLCEDDVGLFALPAPRVADLLRQIDELGPDYPPVGAVVAYGRRFVGRGAHNVNVVPAAGSPIGQNAVDVACWGATLISRSVVDAGVLPDPSWFFGLEDLDFFCQVRRAGFAVLLDQAAARKVAFHQTTDGRDQVLRDHRPTDRDEPWRSYYHSRNSFALARRHGRPSWHAWHFAFTLRHLQKAHGRAQRAAILHGVWDGALGRMGENPRYGRKLGEFDSQPPQDGPPSAS
jgi:hypothetical protein